MDHSWKKVCIAPTASIKQAIESITASALQIALVTTQDMKLLGTITDGDIRRGLLKSMSFDTPVTEIMNAHPKTANRSTSDYSALSTMKEYSIAHLPIINNGYLVGLKLASELTKPRWKPNPIFIMAGGFGTRLRPLTETTPKPMLQIGDKPMLEIIIEKFKQNGFREFFISTYYLPDVIKNHFGDGSGHGVSIQYVEEHQPLGTAGAISLLPKEKIKHPFIMMNGDILTDINFDQLLDFHCNALGTATVCVKQYDYTVPYGVIESDGKYITGIVEKPNRSEFVNAGIYVLNPNSINKVQELLTERNTLDMPDLLNLHQHENHKIALFPIHEYWRDIGKIHDFHQAQEDIKHISTLKTDSNVLNFR